jgi:DNA mismatch endonuclease (patch repair protein)
MSRHPRRDTGPEMVLRRLLHGRGLRYRVGYPVPDARRRTIDIAFPGAKVAVFVDGCFWHGCTAHRTVPTANAAWWQQKLEKNRERDQETSELLERAGWLCLRFWEHEEPDQVVHAVEAAVRQRRQASAGPS